MLLLTVQVECNLTQVEMSEIERITWRMTVERLVSDESDDNACWSLEQCDETVTAKVGSVEDV